MFGSAWANVQPHSGAQANFAVFLALLQPGDTIMGLDLSHGGHLTHGSPVNVSGKWFNVVQYGVDKETQRLDMEAIRQLAVEHKPKLIVCGYSAYPRTIDFAAFRAIADEVGAYLLADMAHIAGLVAAGVLVSSILVLPGMPFDVSSEVADAAMYAPERQGYGTAHHRELDKHLARSQRRQRSRR